METKEISIISYVLGVRFPSCGAFGNTAINVILGDKYALAALARSIVLACLQHVDNSGSMMRYFEDLFLNRAYLVHLGAAT